MDTEFEMRLPVERMSSKSSVGILALDWEAIGRFVRVRTLEAVAGHFAATAVDTDVRTPNRGLQPARTSARAKASRLMTEVDQGKR